MCDQLSHTPVVVTVSAADLERLLEIGAGVCALADTIEMYWSQEEKAAVLHWVTATMGAEAIDAPVQVPPIPDVLLPFMAASLETH